MCVCVCVCVIHINIMHISHCYVYKPATCNTNKI